MLVIIPNVPPPPPRNAQYSSVFVVAFAVTISPLATNTSNATVLSTPSPYIRESAYEHASTIPQMMSPYDSTRRQRERERACARAREPEEAAAAEFIKSNIDEVELKGQKVQKCKLCEKKKFLTVEFAEKHLNTKHEAEMARSEQDQIEAHRR